MKKASPAFTLVEVLVVAPLIILFIGAFIGLVVTLTGDSLKLRESNAAAFGVQDALDEMGTASGNALGFLTTTGPLVAPQGSGNNTAAFTNVNSGQANTLIMSSVATTKNPYDVSRQPIYTGSSPCSSSNPVYSYTTVYFISGSSLYKRTILPASPAPCTTPWQKPSCEESRVASNPAVCKASDEKLLDNVAGMTITYYNSASSTSSIPASQAEDAVSVSIQLEASKSVAGETVNYTGSSRVKKSKKGATTSVDYSDDFAGSGALGNVKTGAPTIAWEFLNSASADWTRNSSGYASSSIAASSNPMAIANAKKADIEITEGIRSAGDAIYFRVTDANNWLRARLNYVQDSSTYTYYSRTVSYECYSSSTGAKTKTGAWGFNTNDPNDNSPPNSNQCPSGSYYSETGRSTTGPHTGSNPVYNYYLVLDKNVSGTITQLGSRLIGTSMPAYIKVTAKGTSLTTSYGSTTSTTSAGSSISDSAHQSATKHGIGYAAVSYGSPATGVSSIAIIDAP